MCSVLEFNKQIVRKKSLGPRRKVPGLSEYSNLFARYFGAKMIDTGEIFV